MIRNKGFYEFCKEFFEAALSLLDLHLGQEENVINEWVEEVEFLEDGGIRPKSQMQPSYSILLAQLNNEIKVLPEFVALLNFVENSELAKELLVDYQGSPVDTKLHDFWLYQSNCYPLISRYLSEAHSLEFREEVFSKLYEGVEEFCYCPTIRVVHTAPLFYFDMEASESAISLSPHLSIRKLTALERNHLWCQASDSPLWSRQDIYNLRFAAEAVKETSKQNLFFDSKEKFITLEALLRLITRQPVAINFVLQRQEPWFNNRASIGSLSTWPKTRQQRLMPQYASVLLNSQHITLLQRLWTSSLAIGNNTRFTLALNRFSSSYDEAKIEDKLLDLWIGLETLFSEGINMELKYRISLRIAYFLGKTADTRDKILTRTRESYDCRSSIVHGSQIKGDINAITKQTENYLVASLKRCLASKHVPSGEELDARIIRGDNYPISCETPN